MIRNEDTGSQSPDVAIIGGGVIGCALAYDLARQGVTVELFESQDLAREASWASGGIISAPAPRHGAVAEFALLGYRRYPQLVAEIEEQTGTSVGWHQNGQVIAGTADQEDALRDVMNWQQEHGIEVAWLDAEALHEQEPALDQQFRCGIYAPQSGNVLLDRMTITLARAARRWGATINEHSPVQGIETAGGRATGLRTFDGSRPTGAVVIAAGAWSRMFGESIDFAIPTRPVRGQVFKVLNPPVPVSSNLAGAGIYLVPRADGSVSVGATEEHEAGFDRHVTPEGLDWLFQRVEQLAPSLNHGQFAAAWAGLRPGSEDGNPIIGRVPHLDNVWIATGHFRSGALLAPATSELLAGSIISGTIDPRLVPFDPARFH